MPDPAGRLPGRGAWVHPTAACLAQAERRRAFGRALRLTAGTDLERVRAYVDAIEHDEHEQESRGTSRRDD